MVIALGSIIGGQILEGGHVGSIMQLTAFIIVIGGTFGAICIQNPLSVVIKAFGALSIAVAGSHVDNKGTIKLILDLANISRKQGLLALEGKLKDVKDPFMKKGVQLIVDGTEPKAVHEILEIEVEHHEEQGVIAAKVWEAAGGYAPTVGIIGAVLGLIHVMENLADPSKLGGGIAVAFVATVYGVGAANLFFLPLANKIKLKLKEEAGARNLMIMGLVGLAQGENPRLLQEKLEGFLPHHERTKEGKK
ncbi:MAG: flagellar motor protein MotA [Nitrospira sp. HN-bin3]|nr:MAG: flagellar motor protein MotA [Nitrospira sp. HN-bin3]